MSSGDAQTDFVQQLSLVVLRRQPTNQEVAAGLARIHASGDLLDFLQDLTERALGEMPQMPEGAVVPAYPPGHFYSPIVDPREATRYLDRGGQPPETLPGIGVSRAGMLETWRMLEPLLLDQPFGASVQPDIRYPLANGAFAGLDGLVLQAMIRHFRPRRIVEIGSGFSSLCMVETLRHCALEPCALTLIEPYPDLHLFSALPDAREVATLLPQPVQEVPLALYDTLEANDVLFIDSSHVLKAGSDVQHELFEILPRLRPGVVVHLHDIFWPFEYPREWLIDHLCSWNELYALRALLADSCAWQVLMFNDWMLRFEPDRVAAVTPAGAPLGGGSIWLRKTDGRGSV